MEELDNVVWRCIDGIADRVKPLTNTEMVELFNILRETISDFMYDTDYKEYT